METQQLFDVAAYIGGDMHKWDMWAANQSEARRIAERELKNMKLGGWIVAVKPHLPQTVRWSD